VEEKLCASSTRTKHEQRRLALSGGRGLPKVCPDYLPMIGEFLMVQTEPARVNSRLTNLYLQSRRVGIVLNLSPSKEHFAISLAALEAGRHSRAPSAPASNCKQICPCATAKSVRSENNEVRLQARVVRKTACALARRRAHTGARCGCSRTADRLLATELLGRSAAKPRSADSSRGDWHGPECVCRTFLRGRRKRGMERR
jgi:hypothetical protein